MKKLPVYAIYIYFFLSFSGVFFATLPFGTVIQKLMILLLVTLLFLFSSNYYIPKNALKYFYLTVCIAMYAFFSVVANGGSWQYIFFVSQQYLFICIIFIASLQCAQIAIKVNFRLGRILALIIISQFLFSLLKFIILGRVDESFLIGSMHNNAGQLGFLFPAIMIPLVVFTFYKKSIVLMTILVVMCLIFGALNEKRAIFYIGPILFISSLLVVRGRNGNFSSKFKILIMFFLASLTLAPFFNLIESLSLRLPEIYDGDSLILYSIYYAFEYLTMNYDGPLQGSLSEASENTKIQVGRFLVWLKGLEIFYELNWINKLFGYGMGSITESVNLQQNDILFSTFGFRGAMNGALKHLLEGGILGFFLFSGLFLLPTVSLIKSRQMATKINDNNSLQFINILLIIQCVFLFDNFFYSTISLTTLPIVFLYFIQIFSICSIESRVKKRFVSYVHCH